MPYEDLLELNRRQPRRIYNGGGSVAPARMGATTGAMTGAATLLAYLGAAPLVAASLVIIAGDGPAPALASDFMTLYGAALIVFFGGVRWGVAVMQPGGARMRALLGAALPFLAALPLFTAGADTALKMPVIMALLALMLADDLRATRAGSGAPEWYLAVRLPLTVLIEVAFLVALAGMR